MRNRASGADGAAGRHFEIACLYSLRVEIHSCPGINFESSIHIGTTIHRLQRQSKRKTEKHPNPLRRRDGRKPGVRDFFRQTDVDVQPERRRDLVLEELSQAAMPRIDTL
jgi:hypothetical protein